MSIKKKKYRLSLNLVSAANTPDHTVGLGDVHIRQTGMSDVVFTCADAPPIIHETAVT